MGQPFVGEVRLVGFNFAPVGWAMCYGQELQISTNPTLYTLIGTTYGGDGVNTFGVPDLRGRVAVHQGQGLGLSPYVLGQSGGMEQVSLATQNYPAHTHPFLASQNEATLNAPAGNTLGGGAKIYEAGSATLALNPAMVSFAGGTNAPVPHENRQPFLALNWIIALEGVYPSQG